MTAEQLRALSINHLYQEVGRTMPPDELPHYTEREVLDTYQAGFKKALQLVLEKREEFGHGYLKSKLLDWVEEASKLGE